MGVKYVAHRGGKIYGGVENTLEAFLGGVKSGADALECDVRVTSDLVYVIHHDSTFEKLTKESNNPTCMDVNQSTYDELKEVELVQSYKDKTYTGRILLFSKYLEICRDNNVIPVVELKWTNGIYSDNADENNFNYSNLDKVISMLKEYQLFDKVYVISFMKGCLEYLRKKYPTIKLQWLCYKDIEQNLDWCVKNNISLDVEHSVCTKEMISTMHSNGLLVNIWTMNDETLLSKYIDMGVDMITSDWIIRK